MQPPDALADLHGGHKLDLVRTTTSAEGGTGQAGGTINGAGLADTGSNGTAIRGSRFSANSASADTGSNANVGGVKGVGISLQGSTVAMSATTAAGNRGTALGHGAGSGTLAEGGGIFVDVPAILTNVTASGNSLDAGNAGAGVGGLAAGGGIYAGSAFALWSSTVADNSVRAPGTPAGSALGGNVSANVNPLDVKNTIVSHGHGDAGHQNCHQPLSSGGHNIDSLDQCGFHAGGDQTGKDPLLAVLRNNGGAVPTRALRPGSPALNKGTNAGCPGHDARGAPRPVVVCDVGASEAQPAPVITGLAVKPQSFKAQSPAARAAAAQGATVSYTDSRPALTTLTVLKIKQNGGSTRVGSFTHQDVRGANHFHFRGRINGHKLSPGSYRLRAVPSLWAVTGQPKSTTFTIVG